MYALHGQGGAVSDFVREMLEVGKAAVRVATMTSMQLCSQLLEAPRLVPFYADQVSLPTIALPAVPPHLARCTPFSVASKRRVPFPAHASLKVQASVGSRFDGSELCCVSGLCKSGL